MSIIDNPLNNLSKREVESLLFYFLNEKKNHTYLLSKEDMEQIDRDIEMVRAEVILRKTVN